MCINTAHFTLDGLPLCQFQADAYRVRLLAAGSPRCDAPIDEQTAAFDALAGQFPGRIALVHGACPISPAQIIT